MTSHLSTLENIYLLYFPNGIYMFYIRKIYMLMLLQNEKMMNILFQSCISWLRWNKVLDPAAVFFCRLDWSESVPVYSGLEK